jgi:hypothetical protein
MKKCDIIFEDDLFNNLLLYVNSNENPKSPIPLKLTTSPDGSTVGNTLFILHI